MRCQGKQTGVQRGRQVLPGLVASLFLLACAPSSAQVYKWTDARGTVHYTDAPPPRQAARELRTPSSNASGQALPYELARAVKASPVTLYTTTQMPCAGCEQGRALLRARGVPYLEKTVDTGEDQDALRQLTGKLELPVLTVGSRRISGFEDAAWRDALSAAAYPRSAQLPRGYRYASLEPAAPASVPTPPAHTMNDAAPDEAAAQAAGQQPRRPAARDTTPASKQPATGKAPPGFQF
jgi:glutaredoxin